jgi:hypothetical protein
MIFEKRSYGINDKHLIIDENVTNGLNTFYFQ